MKMKKRRSLLTFALALAFVFSLFPNVNAKAATVTGNVHGYDADYNEVESFGEATFVTDNASVASIDVYLDGGLSDDAGDYDKILEYGIDMFNADGDSVYAAGTLTVPILDGYVGTDASIVDNDYFSIVGRTESTVTLAINENYILADEEALDSDDPYAIYDVKFIYLLVYEEGHSAEPVEYEILDGADQAVTVGAGEDLVVRASGSPDNLDKLLIDDTEVPEASRTITEGSTIATIKAAFLDTLKEGEHTLTFVYTDGEVSTVFTVVKAAVTTEAAPAASVDATTEAAAKTDKSPKTADPLPVAMVTMLMFVSLAGIVVLKKQDK